MYILYYNVYFDLSGAKLRIFARFPLCCSAFFYTKPNI